MIHGQWDQYMCQLVTKLSTKCHIIDRYLNVYGSVDGVNLLDRLDGQTEYST